VIEESFDSRARLAGLELAEPHHGVRGDVFVVEQRQQDRREKGWSQDDLADKVGSAGAHQVSRWENGKTLPSTDTIVKLAECFEVSIDHLLIDDAPRRPLHSEGDGFLGRLGDVGRSRRVR